MMVRALRTGPAHAVQHHKHGAHGSVRSAPQITLHYLILICPADLLDYIYTLGFTLGNYYMNDKFHPTALKLREN